MSYFNAFFSCVSDKSSGKVYYFRKDVWKEIQQFHLQNILSLSSDKPTENTLFLELGKEVQRKKTKKKKEKERKNSQLHSCLFSQEAEQWALHQKLLGLGYLRFLPKSSRFNSHHIFHAPQG